MDTARHRCGGRPPIHAVARADRAHDRRDRRARRAGGARMGARLRALHAQPSSHSPVAHTQWRESTNGARPIAGQARRRLRLARSIVAPGSTERRSRAACAATHLPGGTRVMSTITIEDGAEVSGEDMGQGISAAATSHALFIIPTRWGGGFTASIHGHLLELADPADHRLAPSPDDLLIASVASDLAWSARRFLRAQGLPDGVSVSARWRTTEGL